jgi:hypothetical protein
MDRKHFDFSAPVQNSHLFSGLPGNQSSYSGLKTEAAPIPQEPGVSVQRKLHLVAAAARQIKEPENTRLTLGGYIADILLDARPNARIFHWIVQRVGSAAQSSWRSLLATNRKKPEFGPFPNALVGKIALDSASIIPESLL